jgi:hypothetical protein
MATISGIFFLLTRGSRLELRPDAPVGATIRKARVAHFPALEKVPELPA